MWKKAINATVHRNSSKAHDRCYADPRLSDVLNLCCLIMPKNKNLIVKRSSLKRLKDNKSVSRTQAYDWWEVHYVKLLIILSEGQDSWQCYQWVRRSARGTRHTDCDRTLGKVWQRLRIMDTINGGGYMQLTNGDKEVAITKRTQAKRTVAHLWTCILNTFNTLT